ncbi:tetratricopeptide repeat protein [uncultured Roseobacter sp.]|uniref:tetratricopeptide repeat protein n=1 Tax=uncultured Roseobacter sp. TaxID=114847 RepID=UPI00262C000F|nr:tetratricopeptide repeat protein [uncultured Roseobacter sp.]
MAMKPVILKRIVTALVALLLYVAPLHAQQTEAELLQQLQQAPESEAKRLDRELKLLWGRSGSAAMDLLLTRGRDAMEAEDNSKAIDHFTALTDHAPDFAEGWHARATAYYKAGLYGPALDDLERALALNPNNYHAIFGLGVMLQEFGDFERAAEAFDQVLALNPHHENAKSAMQQLKRSGIGRTL